MQARPTSSRMPLAIHRWHPLGRAHISADSRDNLVRSGQLMCNDVAVATILAMSNQAVDCYGLRRRRIASPNMPTEINARQLGSGTAAAGEPAMP